MTQGDSAEVTINTIRCLAVDMVEAAGSGHPGAPMGQAALAYTLWTDSLRFDPRDPDWPNRDRFVLSCGHASALLYSLLHLSGFDLPLDEIRNFRQLGSKTPGHPEHGLTAGVETTTGPLGQGVGNAVGMAMAERRLAAEFNREGFDLFDHRVWVLASDGDLMEGVSQEACSLAGHLGLGKLNVIYDDNRITIDGPAALSFSEDVEARFTALGWHTIGIDDGNDRTALAAAFEEARDVTDRPSLLRVRTVIGYGSPAKQGTSSSHGAKLGTDEVVATKEALGWPLEPLFLVPDEATASFAPARERGRAANEAWRALLSEYASVHSEAAADLDRRRRGAMPDDLADRLPGFEPGGSMATRAASGKVLNAIGGSVTELFGGSADLKGSNNTYLDGLPDLAADEPGGRNINFGVREHGMGAAMNGMALSGLLRPYGGTFLVFSDYMRASIRMAALMELPVVYVFTHDSIFLGEDGPTHQPESHLASLRAIPGLTVIRPADGNETAQAWRAALENTNGPTAIVLTRQGVPSLEATGRGNADGVRRGGYVIAAAEGETRAVLVATGSEVALALGARELLAADGIGVRVVSVPSWELLARQTDDYRASILAYDVEPRLAIEAGSSQGWSDFACGPQGFYTIDRFGASAPAPALATEFGFTAEKVAERVRELLG